MSASVIAEAFREAAGRHTDRLALTDTAGARLSYAELAERAERAAGEELAGRVGLVAANSADYVVAYLAVLRSGGVPFLIDSAFGPNEVALIARETGLDRLVHDERPLSVDGAVPLGPVATAPGAATLTLTRLAPPADRPELLPDTEVCRFTSGSTGKPNCIEFSGATVRAAAANWAEGTRLAGADRVACFAGLSNGLAFNTSLLSVFLVGASLHLSRGLPTGGRIVRLIEEVEATRLVGFPALYESILRRGLAKDVVRRIAVAVSSGAPLRPEARREFAEQTGVSIRSYYGLAEAGPLTFATDAESLEGLGPALPGVSLRAGLPGAPAAVEVRSASMGSRYLNAPGVFEARLTGDGYYRTGDQGFLDADGVLHLTGRTGRVINVGGRKVDPIEVAEVLRGAPGVHQAVVFENVDRHGETQVAAAVATGEVGGAGEAGGAGDAGPAVAAVTAESLREHCAGQLAAYKVPARILVLDEIPGNSIGKPSLSALRELAARSAG